MAAVGDLYVECKERSGFLIIGVRQNGATTGVSSGMDQ